MDGLEVIVSVDRILNIYENYIYHGCSNKRKIYNFEKYKMRNINIVYNILKNNNYKLTKYNIFLIRHPKYRIVMSLDVNDKIINHYITIYSLMPKLEKYLDIRNIATRKNMGCDYGVKLLKKYIEKNKKNGKFYILKLDIKKYFYNIDHEILKNKLKDKLDKDEYNLICSIIDSTNMSYINYTIEKIKEKELKKDYRKKEIIDIPIYNYGKGLPIGNMTSQFLAIYYLSKLDHFIIHNLRIKYMIRYMDDYVFIHTNKKYLLHCKDIIEEKLKNEYKLELNNNKSILYDSYNGFEFLGYKFRVINDKTIVTISNKTFKRIKNKIVLKYSNYNNMYSSINNYYYSFKYTRSLKIKRLINIVLKNI